MGFLRTATVTCLLLVIAGWTSVHGEESDAEKNHFSNEHELYSKLLANYEKSVRPVASHKDAVHLGFGINFVKIQELDEKSQKLIANIWYKMTWKDPQLQWNPEHYNGLKSMRIPADRIWKPDIVLYNMANTGQVEFANVYAVVDNNGTIIYIPHGHTESSCSLDMAKFPYDKHNCSLKFGSWTYHREQVNLDHFYGMSQVDVSNYQEHSEWELVSHNALRSDTKYDCCEEIYQDITLSFVLKRRNSYYTQVFVAPSVVLLFITPTIFWLPPDCNEKMTLGTGIMVGHVLMMFMLENYIPAAHATAPLIGRYFLFGLVMVGMSLILSVMVRNIWSQSNRKRPVPGFVRTVSLRLLGRLLCVSADTWSQESYTTAASFRQLEDLDTNSNQGDSTNIVYSSSNPADEWRRVAVVLDRLLFLLFLAFAIVVTLAMLHY